MENKNKNTTQKEAAVKQTKLLNLAEMKAREAKYINCLNDLKASVQITDEAVAVMEILQRAEKVLEKWRTYLRCDGLPKPYLPSQIRTFFEKLRYYENFDFERTIDWTLAVDECSILSQNIFRVDRTRQTLVNSIRPNLGAECEKNITLGLEVIKKIELYLDDLEALESITPEVFKDVVELKAVIQQELTGFFDRLIYRILSAEESYMDCVSPTIEEYFYKATNFEIHLWAFQNVPIRFRYMENPIIYARLHCINITIQLPMSILEENLTIYGLHTYFDQWSEKAKSFEQRISPEAQKIFIEDLHDCLAHEWQMQLELQNYVRNRMLEKRLDYERKMRLLEEEMEKSKERRGRADNKEPKKEKAKKAPKEPPIVNDETFPDVWEDFLAKEQAQYKQFLIKSFHPDVLNLKDDEVNLKNFMILGGIYKIFFVDKPPHINFKSYNMKWHKDNRKLQVRKNVYIGDSLEDHDSTDSLFRKARMYRTFASEAGQPLETENDDLDIEETPYFVVHFDLPAHLCLWGTPVACHFEEEAIEYIEDNEEDVEIQPVPEKSTSNVKTTIQPNNHDVVKDDEESILSNIVSQFTMIPDSFMSKRSTSKSDIHRRSLFSEILSHAYSPFDFNIPPNMTRVEDFNLFVTLAKTQIRNLERHCLPRILSSFKFPKEIKEAEDEQEKLIQKKNKSSKVSSLKGRRSTADSEQVLEDIGIGVLSVDKQDEPERLFPKFPEVEPLAMPLYMDVFTGKVRSNEPGTFYELIDALDVVKKIYKLKYEKTFKIPFFKTTVKFPEISKDLHHINDLKLSKRRRGPKSVASMEGGISMLINRKRDGRSHMSLKVADTEDVSEHVEEEMEEEEQGDEEIGESEEEEDNRKLIKYSCWTTKYISHSHFDKEKNRITIHTDRLGIMGFAFDRYIHFPFRDWSLKASETDPEREVVLTLITPYVKVVLNIGPDGYHGYVHDALEGYHANPEMRLVIEKPVSSIKELKKLFLEKNLNIFADWDASFYIKKGYFSVKHLAAEIHAYGCMAVHCKHMKFLRCDWNRIAQRRDILLRFGTLTDAEGDLVTARITPEGSTFVDVTELCSNNLAVIILQYKPTWRNLDFYVDLHHLVMAVSLAASELRIKDAKLICHIKNLLREIRPLSYS